MTLPFPSIRCPGGQRTLSPGVYPVRRFVAINGATTTVLRGDRASDARLVIPYPLIRDTEAALVMALWHASLGGFRDVALPANAYAGVDPALVAQVPAYLKWYIAEEPVAESAGIPGWSRMQLNLVGQLDA